MFLHLPNVLDSLSLIQHFQMSHSPAGASPPQNSTSTITTTTTTAATTQQRIRAPIRITIKFSPQNMYTPPLNNNNNNNLMWGILIKDHQCLMLKDYHQRIRI